MKALEMIPTTGRTPWDVTFGGQRVVFGAGSADSLGEVVRNLAIGRALVVTDRGLQAAGWLDRALRSLERAGVRAFVYDGVVENPTTREVEEGRALAERERVDGIVGLGGGSSLDCAKGVNFVLTGGGRMEDYWGRGKARGPMLPSVGLPTTAGTGSEAQSFALISQEATGVKMACGDTRAAFRAVVLDPTMAATAPRPVVALCGVDAVSHVVESYVSRAANPLSRMFGREAWRLLESNFERALAGGDDDVWGGMLLGSFLAGAAIEHSMLGAAHSCANPLTARFHIVHGEAVGLMLPHVMRLNARAVADEYDVLHRFAEAPAAGGLLLRVAGLRSAAGLPERLRDRGVPRETLPALAADAAKQWTAAFNPVAVGEAELLALYEEAY